MKYIVFPCLSCFIRALFYNICHIEFRSVWQKFKFRCFSTLNMKNWTLLTLDRNKLWKSVDPSLSTMLMKLTQKKNYRRLHNKTKKLRHIVFNTFYDIQIQLLEPEIIIKMSNTDRKTLLFFFADLELWRNAIKMCEFYVFYPYIDWLKEARASL